MLVEILVDAIDEQGYWRANRAQARHQMAVSVCAASLEFAWREIKQADEVVDDAMELLVIDQAVDAGANFELAYGADVLERGMRDCREPDLRPRQRGNCEEGQELPAKDLVADRFVEECCRRQPGGSCLLLLSD